MYENRDNSGKERESKEKNKINKDRKGKKDTHTKRHMHHDKYPSKCSSK